MPQFKATNIEFATIDVDTSFLYVLQLSPPPGCTRPGTTATQPPSAARTPWRCSKRRRSVREWRRCQQRISRGGRGQAEQWSSPCPQGGEGEKEAGGIEERRQSGGRGSGGGGGRSDNLGVRSEGGFKRRGVQSLRLEGDRKPSRGRGGGRGRGGRGMRRPGGRGRGRG